MKAKSLFFLLLIAITPLHALEYNAPIYGECGDLSLWSESFGKYDGENAILLVAGCGGNARFWPDCFVQRLVDEGYFVIRYDHRAVGLSSPANDFTVSDLKEDVVAILDAYDIQSAHIVGMSLGGMITQFFAASYPERAKSLVLLATHPVGGTRLLDIPMTLAETATLSNTLHFIISNSPTDQYEESLPIYISRFAYFNGKYTLDEEILTSYVQSIYFRTIHPHYGNSDPHIKAGQHMMETLNNRRHIFNLIEAPTLVIHGAEDRLILVSRGGYALHDAIQGAQLKIYPKMGHSIYNRELLDSLADDILTFVHDKK